MLTQPPHLISPEVLILERELYEIRTARVLVDLRMSEHLGHRWKEAKSTFVTVVSPLFRRPNRSAIGLGIDICTPEGCEDEDG